MFNRHVLNSIVYVTLGGVSIINFIYIYINVLVICVYIYVYIIYIILNVFHPIYLQDRAKYLKK